MKKKRTVSVCCNASVHVEGKETMYYVCDCCQKPADTKQEKKK